MNMKDTYCTFRVGEMQFGVEVTQVQEVIRQQPTTEVPLAPEVVRGLMNLRGQIVPAIDLRRRLELPTSGEGKQQINVVIRTNEEPISLLVDEIGDVVQVETSSFEAPPETLQGTQRSLIRGAFKMDGGLLLILDTQKVVSLAA